VYSDSTTVTLGNGYNELANRTGACQAANVYNYHTGGSWGVKNYTHGQLICNTGVGKETNVWYQESASPYDWSWAGGTNKPDWTGSC
jgi:hypothetical protein